MLKVHILDKYEHCQGQACLPNGEGEDYKGRKYTHFAPCPMCEGSGNQARWVSLGDFAALLRQASARTSTLPIKAVTTSPQAMSGMMSPKSVTTAEPT